jgi:hypothetical protein
MQGTIIEDKDRIKHQRYLCNEILKNFLSGKIALTNLQLLFVEEMRLSDNPIDDVQLGVLRSFMKSTGKK